MKIIRILLVNILMVVNLYAQQTGTITGEVLDKKTQEPLPGVNIQIIGTERGAATDVNGKYTIDKVDVGSYSVQASFIGYNTLIQSDVVVKTAKPAVVDFEMNESAIELQGVTVTSGYFNAIPTEVSSLTMLNYEEIRRSPGGFEDVVRALSVLPGVAQASAGRNDLVVRGGAPSENLYLVDGFIFPTINHFGSQGATGGPLSFINLDFVKETSFSTGGFSSLYGDKLSSVLSINLREGRSDKLGGKALVSASLFGLNLEGPISDNANFLFSVRRSYLDFIFKAAGFGFIPEYYDVMTKVSYDISEHDRLSYLFIGAFDKVKFNNDTRKNIFNNARILASNQNQYVTGLSYRRLLGKGFYTASLSRSFVDYDTFQKDTSFTPIFLNRSKEGENELKLDLVYKVHGNAELNAGVSGKLISFNSNVIFPDNFITTFNDTLPKSNLSADTYFHKYAFYLQYSNLWFNRLRFNLGVRGDYFNEINKKMYYSPRLSLLYPVTELVNISFSVGNYHQFPSYIWLLGNKQNTNLNAIKVTQYVAGIEYRIMEDVRIKLEGFYKDYKDYPTSVLRPYLVLSNTGAGYAGSDDNFASFGLEPLVSKGKGNSKGLEFSMQKKSSEMPMYGLFSLTYSQTKFTSLDGKERPGSYDQKWIFSLSAGYIYNEKWETSLKFRYSTGSPYTPFDDYGKQSVNNYNTDNFTASHSLDLRVERKWNFESWDLTVYLDVQNVYGRKNQTSIRWDYEKNKLKDESSIGLLPSIGISVEF